MKQYLILLLALALTNCSSGFESNEALLAKLNQAMEPVRTMRNGYTVVDMDSLTNFPWDSVYFFHSEEPASFIGGYTGAKWDGPDVRTDHNRLVFVHQGKVVTYVDCNEGPANAEMTQFPPLPLYIYTCHINRARAFARKDARFAAFRKCTLGIIHYCLVPLGCKGALQSVIDEGCPESQETYIPGSVKELVE